MNTQLQLYFYKINNGIPIRITPYYCSLEQKHKDIQKHKEWLRKNKRISKIKYRLCFCPKECLESCPFKIGRDFVKFYKKIPNTI